MRTVVCALLVVMCTLGCQKEPTSPTFQSGDFLFAETAPLPSIIDESSGLETAANEEFWSFNDSNGAAALYRFDTTGTLNQVLNVTNATNVDWEDIAQDESGNLYVGDFGNNDNDRRNLIVYKINAMEAGANSNAAPASRINFSFPEQIAFPPADADAFFDVESMFARGDFLYLLTRDRSDPFVGKTILYRLPNATGTHDATFITKFFTNTNKDKEQITAADISPDGRTLAVISKEKIWLFQNIVDDGFFAPERLELDLPVQLDMEGVVFTDDCTLYLSNEDKPRKPAVLYRIKLCE